MIIISDCLHHDAIAVYVFLKALNEFLSSFLSHVKRLIYFSDGAPSQFKNYKHLSNVYYHEQDFHRLAVWHYQVTAHGKGPCDGAGAILKRMASIDSLQMTDTQISTPKELYEWANQSTNLPNIKVMYKNKTDYDEAKRFLEPRFENCKSIPHTQELHCVEPRPNFVLRVKPFSFAVDYKDISILKTKKRNRSD